MKRQFAKGSERMNKRTPRIIPEWHYPVPAEEIGRSVTRFAIEAGEEEKESIARRLAIVRIELLHADISMSRDQNDHIIHICGTLTAEVIQECVVTLEPVSARIEEKFEGWFADNEKTVSFEKARRDRLKLKAGIDVPILEENEDPEPIVDGIIDIGELVVQNLSLLLPVYPHSEGVVFEQSDEDKENQKKSELRKNPFSALKDWKSQ